MNEGKQLLISHLLPPQQNLPLNNVELAELACIVLADDF